MKPLIFGNSPQWHDGDGSYDDATSLATLAVASCPDCRFVDRPLWAVFILALVLLGGCAGFEPQPGPLPEPGGQYVTLTTPFIAVGDTQEHESTGYPLHDNDSAIDAFVEVAQRPPEQPLFGRRILEWALEHDPDEPFIHLGDVMDLSCQSEAQRMDRIFKGARQPVAILPGNHDGLMFGIYGYRLLDAVMDAGAKRWNRACRRGAAPEDSERKTDREALSKRDFIVRYLRNKARSGRAPGLPDPPVEGDFRISWRNPDPQAFISAMEVRLLDGYQYADSFLAQRLRLPRAEGAPRGVVIIGLDTNQAGSLVSTWDTLMGRSPGTTGHIHPDQIQVVRDWVIEAVITGDIVVFAGHHNWSNLGLPSRLLLRNLMSILRHPLVYLSAHTHRGFWAVHTLLALRPVLELNVSSLSDWPIGYRRISFAIDEQANRLLVRGDLMPHAAAPSLTDDDLMAAWEAQTCARSGLKPEIPAHTRRRVGETPARFAWQHHRVVAAGVELEVRGRRMPASRIPECTVVSGRTLAGADTGRSASGCRCPRIAPGRVAEMVSWCRLQRLRRQPDGRARHRLQVACESVPAQGGPGRCRQQSSG
jgi:hypothetical protein